MHRRRTKGQPTRHAQRNDRLLVRMEPLLPRSRTLRRNRRNHRPTNRVENKWQWAHLSLRGGTTWQAAIKCINQSTRRVTRKSHPIYPFYPNEKEKHCVLSPFLRAKSRRHARGWVDCRERLSRPTTIGAKTKSERQVDRRRQSKTATSPASSSVEVALADLVEHDRSYSPTSVENSSSHE